MASRRSQPANTSAPKASPIQPLVIRRPQSVRVASEGATRRGGSPIDMSRHSDGRAVPRCDQRQLAPERLATAVSSVTAGSLKKDTVPERLLNDPRVEAGSTRRLRTGI